VLRLHKKEKNFPIGWGKRNVVVSFISPSWPFPPAGCFPAARASRFFCPLFLAFYLSRLAEFRAGFIRA